MRKTIFTPNVVASALIWIAALSLLGMVWFQSHMVRSLNELMPGIGNYVHVE